MYYHKREINYIMTHKHIKVLLLSCAMSIQGVAIMTTHNVNMVSEIYLFTFCINSIIVIIIIIITTEHIRFHFGCRLFHYLCCSKEILNPTTFSQTISYCGITSLNCKYLICLQEERKWSNYNKWWSANYYILLS